MDHVSNLSDHRPIHLHMSFSSVKKGNGFWRFNNELQNDLKYIQGCNETITSTLLQYSEQLMTIKMNQELTREDFADADVRLDISKTLLHDMVLMEVRSYTMKYQAGDKKNEKEEVEKIGSEIDSIQNSIDEKDIERVNMLKEELQSIEDQKDIMNARRYLAKNQIEGERPTKFFCSMNKNMKAKAQFEEVHVVEKERNGDERIRVVKEQKKVEWEVCKFYCSLYRREETNCRKEEILEKIGEVRRISEEESCKLEDMIILEEVSKTLSNTRNNVAPGVGGFSGSFYKVFWCLIKYIVLGTIHEIFENKELPITVRLGIITLIPKGEKDKKFISNWRPLTLLETLYKILSSTLAARLKPVLEKRVKLLAAPAPYSVWENNSD